MEHRHVISDHHRSRGEGLGLSAAAEALTQIYEDLCDNGHSCFLSLSAPWISSRNSIFTSIAESSDARVF